MSSTYGSDKPSRKIRTIQRLIGALGALSPGLAGWLSLQLFSIPMKRVPPDFSALPLIPEQSLIQAGPYRIMSYAWGTGPTLLLVHGWEANADRYLHFVQPLVNAGFRVVAVDGHAHGASGGRLTNLMRSGEALAAVIRQIEPVHGVIAHSYGGGATMALLKQYPRIHLGRVVLIASVNRISDMMMMFAGVLGLSDRVKQAFFEHARRMLRAPVETLDVQTIARQRTEPALIIHDEGDQIVPCSSGRAIADAWPGAQFHQTSKLGHRRILNDDSVIRRVSEFFSIP